MAVGRVCRVVLIYSVFFVFSNPVHALDWSVTELHFQYGNLDVPTFVGGGDEQTLIVTLEHASGWSYGENFFFIDYVQDEFGREDNLYGELYLAFSINKIFKTNIKLGPIRDVSLVMGYNHDDDAKVRKYLPGIRFNLNFPDFVFALIEFTSYIDDNKGVSSGGAPKESDSWHANAAWKYPFFIGAARFSFEGHVEYIEGRRNEFGGSVSSWWLAQPQLRYDLGYALYGKEDQLFIGTEYQYWENKLGDRNTDESVFQALVVWQF